MLSSAPKQEQPFTPVAVSRSRPTAVGSHPGWWAGRARDEADPASTVAELPLAGREFSRIAIDAPRRAPMPSGLALGTQHSEQEHEAERVADQVMRMPDPPRHAAAAGDEERAGSPATPTGVPPIIGDVLRSPGQALASVDRAFMERRFGHRFDRIRIHTDGPAARAASALQADAFTIGQHIAFGREQFAPGTTRGRRLVAHELTHAIQQSATPPYIALSPSKDPPAPVHVASKFDGELLGTNRIGRQILVRREVGGAQGYDDRLQAVAVARLAQAEPAAVALGADGKWHAFEGIGGIIPADAGAKDPIKSASAQFKDVNFLPSRLAIDQAKQKVDELKASRDTPVGVLNKAIVTHAALVLGLPESEVLQITSLSGRVAGKINIIPPQGKGVPGGGHNPLGGETGFEEGRGSAIHFVVSEFDNPVRAQTTLFHEVQHLHDWEFAQQWISIYNTETKGGFVKSVPGPFKDWLAAQVKLKRLTKADRELIIMQAADQTAYTEARANVRTFLAALQAGAPKVAADSLVGYAYALKPKKEGGGGQYASPAPGSEVQAALVAELKTAYSRMSSTMKQQYDDAVADARKKYPGAWISELDFSKGARK